MCVFPGQIAKLEEELASKLRAFQLLEDKLKTQEDYEDIKRELGLVITVSKFATISVSEHLL